jgi:hypothetical protein
LEELIWYRIGYEYNGDIISYSNAVTMDFATAISILTKEQQNDERTGVTSFLVKETVKRERL